MFSGIKTEIAKVNSIKEKIMAGAGFRPDSRSGELEWIIFYTSGWLSSYLPNPTLKLGSKSNQCDASNKQNKKERKKKTRIEYQY